VAVNLPGSNSGSEPSLAISNSGIRYVSWQAPGEFANSADGFNFAQPAARSTSRCSSANSSEGRSPVAAANTTIGP
jgi:hypothetical protein